MPLEPGASLGTYQIVAPIGAGGMGEVYKARDTKLGRDVAIKVLPESMATAELLERFEREARAVAALSHPNILAIHDFEKDDALAYIVTELLEGRRCVTGSTRDRCRPAKPSTSPFRSAAVSVRRTAKGSSTGISSRTISF